MHGIRGAFIDFVGDPFVADDDRIAVRHVADGLLVIEDQRIVDFGDHADLRRRYAHLPVEEYPGRLIVPGFVDCHVHYPQTEVVAAYGEQLLEWLEKYIFAAELKFRDRAYAANVAAFFLDTLVSHGTTTAQVFTTTFPGSVDAFFEEAAKRDLCMVAGLTGIDRAGTAPPEYLDTADGFYENSKALISKWHRVGRSRYAITPRFAYGSTQRQLERCGQLKAEHPDCWVNTHMSENPKEIRSVAEFFPGSSDYLEVYERVGIVGPKFTAGHSIHLDASMIDRMAASQSSIAFCPRSNLFLGSGLFKIRECLERPRPIRVGLGTDMGAGDAFSMLPVANDAYKVAALQGYRLSAFKALYLATTGAARSLWLDDEIGGFDVGKYADVVVLDPAPTPELRFRAEHLEARDDLDLVHQRLFGVLTLGDERSIDATYVAGKLRWRRSSADFTRDAA